MAVSSMLDARMRPRLRLPMGIRYVMPEVSREASLNNSNGSESGDRS